MLPLHHSQWKCLVAFQHWAQSFSWKSQECMWLPLLHCQASAYGFPRFWLSMCNHKLQICQDLQNYLGSLMQLPLLHWGKYYPSSCPKNAIASATQNSCSLYAKEKQYELFLKCFCCLDKNLFYNRSIVWSDIIAREYNFFCSLKISLFCFLFLG